MAAENRRLAAEVGALQRQVGQLPPPTGAATIPVAVPDDAGDSLTPATLIEPAVPPRSFAASTLDDEAPQYASPGYTSPGYMAPAEPFRLDYNNGFAILPRNPDETPFSLKINSQNQFRYDAFSRTATFWTNSAGTQLPINNDSSLQIPRGRLIFSGTASTPT